jgi:hypothetical protein
MCWWDGPRRDGKSQHTKPGSQMKKVITSMALAVLCIGVSAQTTTTTTGTTTGGDQNCIAMADEQTWSTLGLNQDQVRRVKEIQTRYKGAKHMDRGTENTMRGTSDDRATPPTGTTGTGTTGTDRAGTTGTTGTTGTDRTGTTGTTGTDRAGTTGTTGTDRAGTTGTTGKDHSGTMGKSSDQLGYDDSNKEAMERELRTVLTTQQFDRYQEWCQDQDATRGGRDNMDR